MRHSHFVASLLLVFLTIVADRAMAESAEAPPAASAGSVLVERFAECFAAQAGSPLTAEDREILAVASGELVGLLFGDRCREGECEAQLREFSCETLAALMDRAMVATPPEWAVALAEALISRSTACLEAEMGRPPTDEEAGWLRQYRELMERQYVDVIALLGCEVDEAQVTACVAEIRTMPCTDADPQALLEGLARTFSGACGEMFTCSALPNAESSGNGGSRTDEVLERAEDEL